MKNIVKKLRLREWQYIYHSQIDFIDFWLNLLMVFLGIHLLYYHPVEKIQYYHFLVEKGITSIQLGLTSLFFGIINLIRILIPYKTNIVLVVAMKCTTLAICSLMFLNIIYNSVVPIAAVFYGMVSVLALDNIRRT